MSRKITIGLLLTLITGLAQAQPFIEGTHYQRISGPAVAIEDRVEVIEAFAYPCGACRNFLPHITRWEANLPEHVDFQRRPVPLQQGWEVFVMGYYTAEVMGLDIHDVHEAVFRAFHDERRRIRSIDDLAAVYAENAEIEADAFVSTAGSFAVDSSLRKNRSDLIRFGIRSTPTMVVQGKWRISPNAFNSYEQMLAAVDFLVAQEAEALGLTSGDAEPEAAPEAEDAPADA
ncbi:MAG: thiol:disulfide interchange protein DsbA/DsbL [Pseudomonadota bacterium]